MKREPVESEAMLGVGYDGRRRVLEIEFADHDVYDYFDVPARVHRGLVRAGRMDATSPSTSATAMPTNGSLPPDRIAA